MRRFIPSLGRYMFDLHLVSWNRPKMTELVIRTIHRNTNRDDYRLVVLDNNSDLETKQMLAHLHDNGLIDEVILMPSNEGLEAARQYLLINNTYPDSRYFVCIDNDCLPPKNWLPDMIDLMEKYEDFAAISQRTQVMIGTGNIFDVADDLGDDIVEFPHPGGSFRIMRTQAVRDVGGWDRKAPGRGAEERFICGKLRDAGYRTAFAVKIQCLHLFGTRGLFGTDRWGYEKDLKPEDTGHSDISHPALTNGDDLAEIIKYAGAVDAERYYSE